MMSVKKSIEKWNGEGGIYFVYFSLSLNTFTNLLLDALQIYLVFLLTERTDCGYVLFFNPALSRDLPPHDGDNQSIAHFGECEMEKNNFQELDPACQGT